VFPDFKVFLLDNIYGDFMTAFKRNFDFSYNYMRDISLNIKKYRKEADITQEQLAVDTGLSYDYIRRIEYKKGNCGCSIDTLYRISVVLNVPLYKMFEKNEEK